MFRLKSHTGNDGDIRNHGYDPRSCIRRSQCLSWSSRWYDRICFYSGSSYFHGCYTRDYEENSILESNLVQTIGSAGESLAAGAIFTMPALFLWAEEGLTENRDL